MSEIIPKPATPELDRLQNVVNDSGVISGFLDWLSEQGWTICETSEDGPRWQDYMPICLASEQLLARYFEIDLNRVEAERRAILEHLRKVREVTDEPREKAS